MNMLGEPSFQGSGQSQHESEMGSNAALTELDKGLSSLRCCPIEQDRVTEASSDTGRGHSNRLEHYSYRMRKCQSTTGADTVRIIPHSFRHLYPNTDTDTETSLKLPEHR
jgi:hypothetical protein